MSTEFNKNEARAKLLENTFAMITDLKLDTTIEELKSDSTEVLVNFNRVLKRMHDKVFKPESEYEPVLKG